MSDRDNDELGFARPIPMERPGPGVADVVQLYNMYATQMRVVEQYQRVQQEAAVVTNSTSSDPFRG